MSGSKMKATDTQIASAYAELQSCRKVANRFGMCVQSVHERVAKLGLSMGINKMAECEEAFLIFAYQQFVSAGKLDELARGLGRTKQFICRKARYFGLTNNRRSKSFASASYSAAQKKWLAENPHPRGALGMKHSQATRDVLSKKSKQMWADMKEDVRREFSVRASAIARNVCAANRASASWKAGWREIGGKRNYYRSRWEANYARYLQMLKERGDIRDWEHEPLTFFFDGERGSVLSYKPDFMVTDNSAAVAYHEVKGWMDDRSKAIISLMEKYHKSVRLVVIDGMEYKEIRRTVAAMIDGWES